jgi:hypothetical protein
MTIVVKSADTMSAPSCALRKVYPPEPEWTTFHSSHRVIWSTDTDMITSNDNSVRESGAQIPKPKGDVGCISKGGYSLRKVLGWDEDFYREVQVCLFLRHPATTDANARTTFINR